MRTLGGADFWAHVLFLGQQGYDSLMIDVASDPSGNIWRTAAFQVKESPGCNSVIIKGVDGLSDEGLGRMLKGVDNYNPGLKRVLRKAPVTSLVFSGDTFSRIWELEDLTNLGGFDTRVHTQFIDKE